MPLPKPRFSFNRFLDLTYKGITTSLVGLSVWAIVVGGLITRDTLKRNKELTADPEYMARVKMHSAQVEAEKEKQREMDIAELAQAAVPSHKGRN